MRISQNPELLDRLAAAWALGTLRGGARRRFETLARDHAPVRAAALVWESRVANLTELQSIQEPGTHVWTRIDNLIRAETEAAQLTAQRARSDETPSAAGWWRNLALWRSVAGAGAVAAVVAMISVGQVRQEMGTQVAELEARLLAMPQVEYVAVLQDDQSAASMLVTFDPTKKQLTLQRVNAYDEGREHSLQLWAVLPEGVPRSLGVLSEERLLKLKAGESDIAKAPVLAVSLEPKGGVSGEKGPTGPVLFKGALIHKML